MAVSLAELESTRHQHCSCYIQEAQYLLWCIVFSCQKRFAELDTGSKAVISGINFCFDTLVIVH